MGLLDKLKGMFSKVDATVNTPPPKPEDNQGSQEPASLAGSTPPVTSEPSTNDTPSDTTPPADTMPPASTPPAV